MVRVEIGYSQRKSDIIRCISRSAEVLAHMKFWLFMSMSLISTGLAIPTFSQPPSDWPALETQRTEVGVWRPRTSGRKGLDKASIKELDAIRSVDAADRLRYAEFLKGENTGIFKLFPDQGCVQKRLINVAGDCRGFVPDSSLYSFRAGKYGGGDVGYLKDRFISKGLFSQSIMVSLGDMAIENVTATHLPVKHLIHYVPATTAWEAEASSKLFTKGVAAGGYVFSKSVVTSAGPTFAVRKIEFNRKGNVTYKTPYGELSLERVLRYKERNDSVYVFRVIRRDEAGVLTLVWKQLSRKDAPAIVFKKGDKYPDLGGMDFLRN